MVGNFFFALDISILHLDLYCQIYILSKRIKLTILNFSDGNRYEFDSDKKIDKINFDLEAGTEVYHACSIVFKGETFVLGGKTQPNQVGQ